VGPGPCLWAGIPPCTCRRGVFTFTGQFPLFFCFPLPAGLRPLGPQMVFRKRAQSRFTLPKKEKNLSIALFHCCLVFRICSFSLLYLLCVTLMTLPLRLGLFLAAACLDWPPWSSLIGALPQGINNSLFSFVEQRDIYSLGAPTLGPPRSASSAIPLAKPPHCVRKWRPLHGGSRPLPLGWNPPISRSASRSEYGPRPPLLASPAVSFRFLRLCLHPFLPSSFLPSFPPFVLLPPFIHPAALVWIGLRHFTSASLEAAPLHLRIIGGYITSPPHHWRLHHFTSASWEAASLHLRIMGGFITSPPHHWRLHHPPRNQSFGASSSACSVGQT